MSVAERDRILPDGERVRETVPAMRFDPSPDAPWVYCWVPPRGLSAEDWSFLERMGVVAPGDRPRRVPRATLQACFLYAGRFGGGVECFKPGVNRP